MFNKSHPPLRSEMLKRKRSGAVTSPLLALWPDNAPMCVYPFSVGLRKRGGTRER